MISARSRRGFKRPRPPETVKRRAHLIAMARQHQPAARTRVGRPGRQRPLKFAQSIKSDNRCRRNRLLRATGRRCALRYVDALETAPSPPAPSPPAPAWTIEAVERPPHPHARIGPPEAAGRTANPPAFAQFQRKPSPRPLDCPRAGAAILSLAMIGSAAAIYWRTGCRCRWCSKGDEHE
jgi:hypothetical protein